jgi:Secretion system C-terminal sorting domain
MKHLFTLVLCLSVFLSSSLKAAAQINAYASVSAVSGTTLTLSSINQTYGSFAAGAQIIIMQMQDNVAGSNTTNTSSYGTLSTIANAGMYEVVTVTSIAGLPTSITISANPKNTYNFGGSSAVQIISFPSFGTPNYTTTAAITALAWNGQIGGVVAMQVPGTLTVAYPITANGAGFQGGSSSSNYEVDCEPGVYASNSSNYATKGQGIQANATGYLYGRAPLASGGGGGSDDNGGGGGGSNYTSGGQGGPGWTCSTTPSGGMGGNSVGTYISQFRIFMGGGGGGGQENNSVGSAGANGGGIILLQANTLASSCTGSVTISANGNTASNSGNDGSGGGGAAGSIVMAVSSFNVPSSCPLTVQGNGGNGGNVTDAGSHGGGGGGGQGVIIYPAAIPTTNITSTSNNGTGGMNSTPATTYAANGTGTNNVGVMGNGGSVTLAISMTDFSGRLSGTDVLLNWNTAMAQGLDHFNVERSSDGAQYTTIGTIKSMGDNNTPENYSYTDLSLQPGTYSYRLDEVNTDGTTGYSPVVVVNIGTTVTASAMSIYPNPATDQFTVQPGSAISGSCVVALVDLSGRTVFSLQAAPANGSIPVTIGRRLTPGIYLVRVGTSAGAVSGKIFIQ